MNLPSSLSILAATLFGLTVASLPQGANSAESAPATRPAAEQKPEVPFLGNVKCPISGEDVDKGVFLDAGIDRVYFCCKKCLGKGKEDPKAVASKAYPASKVVDLKNPSCPVMGDENEDDSGKHAIVVMGRKIHTCCDGCPEDVDAAAMQFLVKALDPKLKVVGNRECPVTGEPVSRNDVVVYKGKIVRLSSAAAVDGFRKDPDACLAKAEASAVKKKAR